MQSWIKIIPVEETTEAGTYFIGRRDASGCDFYSRDKRGRTCFTSKPGLAIRYAGGPGLVRDFARNPGIRLVAIEVPSDSNKRWKRRT